MHEGVLLIPFNYKTQGQMQQERKTVVKLLCADITYEWDRLVVICVPRRKAKATNSIHTPLSCFKYGFHATFRSPRSLQNSLSHSYTIRSNLWESYSEVSPIWPTALSKYSKTLVFNPQNQSVATDVIDEVTYMWVHVMSFLYKWMTTVPS
jgi:hypothetical protein